MHLAGLDPSVKRSYQSIVAMRKFGWEDYLVPEKTEEENML